MRALKCLMMLGLCVAINACGARREAAQIDTVQLAALPAPGSLQPRMISDGGGRYPGYLYQSTLPTANTVLEGSFLNYFPAASGTSLDACAYAMYYLPVDDPASGSLSLSMSWWVEPVFGRAFLAVANQARGAWEWHSVTSAQQEISLSTDTDYVDAEGGLLVALVIAPSAHSASLAYFTLETVSGTGWKYTQIDSENGPPYNSTLQLEDVALLAGKPAIAYQRLQTEQPPLMQLALCSTADGLGSWEVLDLGALPTNANISVSLAEIAGGYGLAYSVSDNSGSGELHYRFVAQPDPELADAGFVDNLAWQDINGGFVWPKLIEVEGKPVIAVLGRNDGSYKPYYVAGDDSGLIWTPIKASDKPTPDAVTVEDSLPRPLIFGGVPLLASLSDDGGAVGVFVHVPGDSTPQNAGDWTSLRLGDAIDSRSLHSASLAGQPVFSANNLYNFPQVCKMFSLSGNDPLMAGNWTGTVLDNIGVSFSSQVQVFSLAGGLGIMAGDSYGVSEPDLPFLDGQARTARLFTGSAIVNDALQWNMQVVEHDNSGTILDNMRFIDLGGQPAYAAVQFASVDDTVSGTETTLRWGVLTPD